MESLFSLEVIVNYLKLNNLRPPNSSNVPTTSCLFPSVAFRLLDYPVVAINLLDDFDAKELKSKLQITQPFELIEKLPCFTELLDLHGRYIFSKGKSCLFRADIETLRGHLRNTPMYLMILDTYFEPYKLIGTVPVPLTNLMNEIYNETIDQSEPSATNLDTPCIKMTHGIFDIRNLMGEEIGHISFACRFTSYGKSLLSHIDKTTTEGAQRRLKQVEQVKRAYTPEAKVKNNQIKEDEIKEKSTSVEKEQEVYLYELHKKTSQATTNTVTLNQNALVQTLSIDYKDAQIQISDFPNSNKTDKSTQSPNTRRKLKEPVKQEVIEPKRDLYKIQHIEDEFVFNHFCPPALHYNSESKSDSKVMLNRGKSQEIFERPEPVKEKSSETVVSKVVNEKIVINKRIEYLKHAVIAEEKLDSEEDEQDKEAEEEFWDEPEYYIQKIQPSTQTVATPFNFDQMPLLKCLFDEMTKLKNLIENSNSSKIPNSPKKTSNVQNVISNKTKQASKPNKNFIKPPTGKTKQLVGILRHKSVNKEQIIESVNRLSQPRASTTYKPPINNKANNLSNLDYDEIPVRGPKNEELVNKKEPKKPLKYGITNTHRMRVLASRPNQVKEIDQKHDNLLQYVKKNLDDLNLSTATSIDQTSETKLQKNLERALFNNTGSSSNLTGTIQQRTINSFKNTNGSAKSMNLSLLNKVEMESTFDTMNYQHTNFARYENELDSRINSNYNINQQASSTKVVQFGNTYVYNTSSVGPHSDESAAVTSPSSNSTTQTNQNNKQNDNSNINENRSSIDESSYSKDKRSNKNIFIANKNNKYDDDFHSSLDSTMTSSKHSTTTTSNFITANLNKNGSPRQVNKSKSVNSSEELYEEEEEENEEDFGDSYLLGKINQSDLRTSSRYSNSLEKSYNTKSFLDDESLSSSNRDSKLK